VFCWYRIQRLKVIQKTREVKEIGKNLMMDRSHKSKKPAANPPQAFYELQTRKFNYSSLIITS
jgi:hypothetical protein